MHVRLTTQRVGSFGIQREGDVIDVDAAEARRLCESQQAEPVAPEVRTADAPPPSHEATKGPKARKR
jgi:hypothetical protein